VQDFNRNCAAALSISVITIVNVSARSTRMKFDLYQVDLKTEHLRGHDFRNLCRKIADLELLTELHWLQIFLRSCETLK